MDDGWHFIIDRTDFDRHWRVFGADLKRDGTVAEISPLTLTVRQRGEAAQVTPFIDLPKREVRGMLQALVDAAWKEGIRPSELEDWRARVNGKDAHLADMRKLVAKLTETKLD